MAAPAGTVPDLRRARWRPAAGALALLLPALWLAWRAIPPLPPPSLAWSARVLDRAGRPLRLFTTARGYWRLPLDLERLDPRFVRALLTIEDRRFFHHPGVDPLAILRAAAQALGRGQIHSGASTLSMQVARLLYPSHLGFRYFEAVPRAPGQGAEASHRRDYGEQSPHRPGVRGTAAVAENPSATGIHPRRHGWAAKLHQAWYALRLERALSKPDILRLYLELAPYGGNLQGLAAASRFYFGHGPEHLRPSETALLLALPQAPEARRPDRHPRAARRARHAILQRLVAAGLLTPDDAALADRQPLPRRRPAPFDAPHLAARLARGYSRRDPIRTTLDGGLQRRLQDLARRLQGRLPAGDTLALLVVDHATREVLAHIGSGDFLSAGQLDLTRAVRSPGSTLKPFIYGLGFELGLMHPETRFVDRPPPPGAYAPANFDGRHHGVVSLTQALILSLNTPAVAALARIGPGRLSQRLRRLNVDLRLPRDARPGLPIALGGAGLRLEDLAALYAALAEGGRYRPLRFTPGGPDPERRLLSPGAAWQIDRILAQVPPPQGFADDRPIRYKTGTSYGYRDAWAIGYDPRYTVAVWVGRPDGGYHPGASGARRAAPILFQVFAYLPRSRATPTNPPPGLLVSDHRHLPPALRWLGPAPGQRQARILYPPPGARLRLRPGEAVDLKAQDGHPPYRWLVNGRPLDGHRWLPDGPGRHRIRLLDAAGRGDVVEPWVDVGG